MKGDAQYPPVRSILHDETTDIKEERSYLEQDLETRGVRKKTNIANNTKSGTRL